MPLKCSAILIRKSSKIFYLPITENLFPNFLLRQIAANSRGVAFVELTVTLVSILIVASAVIDFWKVFREADIIQQAMRHGARVAGAQANIVFQTNLLVEACGGAAVLDSGVALAHTYLQATNLETADCIIEGTTTRSCQGNSFLIEAIFVDTCEDGYAQRSIEVSANLQARRCLFCFWGRFNMFPGRLAARFPAEVDCNPLGAICP